MNGAMLSIVIEPGWLIDPLVKLPVYFYYQIAIIDQLSYLIDFRTSRRCYSPGMVHAKIPNTRSAKVTATACEPSTSSGDSTV